MSAIEFTYPGLEYIRSFPQLSQGLVVSPSMEFWIGSIVYADATNDDVTYIASHTCWEYPYDYRKFPVNETYFPYIGSVGTLGSYSSVSESYTIYNGYNFLPGAACVAKFEGATLVSQVLYNELAAHWPVLNQSIWIIDGSIPITASIAIVALALDSVPTVWIVATIPGGQHQSFLLRFTTNLTNLVQYDAFQPRFFVPTLLHTPSIFIQTTLFSPSDATLVTEHFFHETSVYKIPIKFGSLLQPGAGNLTYQPNQVFFQQQIGNPNVVIDRIALDRFGQLFMLRNINGEFSAIIYYIGLPNNNTAVQLSKQFPPSSNDWAGLVVAPNHDLLYGYKSTSEGQVSIYRIPCQID